MIDYGLFHFAAPPLAGIPWFTKAAGLAGLEFRPAYEAYLLFGDARSVLRVSMVCHPCKWLQRCFTVTSDAVSGFVDYGEFADFDHTSFNAYIRDYLHCLPGGVGGMFSEYQANSVMKVEDMPWAMVELLESLGVRRHFRHKVISMGPFRESMELPVWDTGLRKRVVGAEMAMCDAYGYY